MVSSDGRPLPAHPSIHQYPHVVACHSSSALIFGGSFGDGTCDHLCTICLIFENIFSVCRLLKRICPWKNPSHHCMSMGFSSLLCACSTALLISIDEPVEATLNLIDDSLLVLVSRFCCFLAVRSCSRRRLTNTECTTASSSASSITAGVAISSGHSVPCSQKELRHNKFTVNSSRKTKYRKKMSMAFFGGSQRTFAMKSDFIVNTLAGSMKVV